MACLAPLFTPTRRTGRVEHVVVDENYRDRGIREQLIRTLIAEARTLRIERLDLSSNPRRKAANALYKRLGFRARYTNAYRLNIKISQ